MFSLNGRKKTVHMLTWTHDCQYKTDINNVNIIKKLVKFKPSFHDLKEPDTTHPKFSGVLSV